MRIAIDLDGVCYEFERTARYMLREYRGCGGLETASTEWDWIKRQVGADDWKWLWSEGVKLGLFRYGHMVKGCRIGLQELTRKHKIEIVTHRPRRAVTDTMDWVSLFFRDIPLDGFHMLSDGEPKSVIACDILIDDKPENLAEWASHGRTGIILTQPWNWRYRMGRVHRAAGWKGVSEIVGSLQS